MKIYIIGHKNPDLDSVAAAITYAKYKNIVEKTDKYCPAVTGVLNKETKFVLEKFSVDAPKVLTGAKDCDLILVDHNESQQSIDGVEEARIHEILDHHKLDFSYPTPIKVTIESWGASCTIIANLFFANNLEIDQATAGLMLSAILVDTVISKSPTCTEIDIETMDKLAQIAGVDSWKDYGMELFKVRSDMSDMSEEAIIKSDYKDFDMGGRKIGIGQVETADLSEFIDRQEKLLATIEKIKVEGEYFAVILFLTDIIKEGSLFLVKTDDARGFQQAFGENLDNNSAYVAGIISRKKQVAPKLMEVYQEN